MQDENLIYEQECDILEDWESNTILIKDGKGNIIEREIPDDIEEECSEDEGKAVVTYWLENDVKIKQMDVARG